MSQNSAQHNIAAVRNLLKDAFTADTLWRFCQERADFQPVLFEIGRNASQAEMIDVLLEHCRTQLLFDELIAAIREVNPRQYERYQVQFYSGSTTPPPVPQIPHNLPPHSEFVGRDKEKARIHEALRSRYFLISIEGIGGIGKTALALEVAYEYLHASQSDDRSEGIVAFDSIVWATAKDRELTLNALLDAIAFTLDYPGIVQRPLPQKRIGVEKLLREKPCLLIVDNFETIADDEIRCFLRYLPEPSKALITTREQNIGHVWAIPLKGLNEAEALELIRSEGRRLALAAIEKADDQVLLHLQAATGGVPLALKWSVGQIKQRGQSLDAILAALHEARGSIFEDIFARSWELLLPDARRVLMILPLFATSASRAATEAASDVHHFALDEALGLLTEMSLVEAAGKLESRRYAIHPLTRSFVSSRLDNGSEFLHSAQRRLADHFRAFTQEYGGPWSQQEMDKLDPDLPNILATIEWCMEQQFLDSVMDIFYHGISTFLIFRGYWDETLTLGHRVVVLATELGDDYNAARCQVWPIARILRYRDVLEEAKEQTVQALAVFERLDAEKDIAYAKSNLGRIVRKQGALDQAERLFQEALGFYQSLGPRGHERHVPLVMSYLAETKLKQGDLEQAQRLSQEAVAFYQMVENEQGSCDLEIAGQLEYVQGRVERQKGNLHQARKHLGMAFTHISQANRLDAIANCKLRIAEVEIDMGQKHSAAQELRDALEIYRALDMQSRIREVIALLAELEKERTSEG